MKEIARIDAKTMKRITTIGFLACFVLAAWAVNHLLFTPHLKNMEIERESKAEVLQEYQSLLSQKEALENAWEGKQTFAISGSTGETLNLWVRALMLEGEQESIRFDKLEPHEVKGKKKEIGIYLTFDGEIKKFVSFLYYLLEKHPAATLEVLSVKAENAGKTLGYEMTLGKTVS